MKDSGVSWLGEIPEHWSVVPLKTAFTRVKRKPIEGAGIVTAFRDGEVTLRSNRRSEGYTEADDYSGYQRILPNDLAIHAMDAFAGAIGVSDSDGMCSPVLSVCVANYGNDPRFMGYQIRLMAKRGWIESLSRSVRERTSEFRWAEAGKQKVALPPADEQKSIADFLDRELRLITELTDSQVRFLELIKERRQREIDLAVTTGYQYSSEMKAVNLNGIRSEILSHWTVRKLKSLSSQISKGTTPSTLGAAYESSGIRFIRGEDLVDGKLTDEGSVFISHEAHETMSRSQLADQDILYVIAGTLGKTALVQSHHLPLNTNQAICFIRLKNRWMAEWVKFWLESSPAKNISSMLAVTAAQPNLSMESLGSFVLPVPSRSEQEAAVKYLKQNLEKLDLLAGKAKTLIRELEGRRSALVSAAVTGKIDVRGKS
ncbi:restriction endonuclease subunit S [Rhodoluna limnophila]|uniref:restriction endonuclease subunit S n=1 Tax=Rhodoluna limnophila TaxID=232537 RepID=UPI00110701EA|nr:restriction endonuclease subunit S [Rhodoluna limnophila]